MRPEHFFALLYLGIENEDEKEQIRKNFVKQLKIKNEKCDIDDIKTDKEIVDLALSVGDDVLEFFESVTENIVNPTMLIIKGIRTIGKIVRKK